MSGNCEEQKRTKSCLDFSNKQSNTHSSNDIKQWKEANPCIGETVTREYLAFLVEEDDSLQLCTYD